MVKRGACKRFIVLSLTTVAVCVRKPVISECFLFYVIASSISSSTYFVLGESAASFHNCHQVSWAHSGSGLVKVNAELEYVLACSHRAFKSVGQPWGMILGQCRQSSSKCEASTWTAETIRATSSALLKECRRVGITSPPASSTCTSADSRGTDARPVGRLDWAALKRPPYSQSLAMGWPAHARCFLIWCGRPVFGLRFRSSAGHKYSSETRQTMAHCLQPRADVAR